MELNPSVIDQKLLETAINEQSKQGETRRLSQEHPVDWGAVLSVRLEFQGKSEEALSIIQLSQLNQFLRRHFKNRPPLDVKKLDETLP